MTLSINNNSLSLYVQRRLAEHADEASHLIARVSAGSRIAGATDDPAGQAISSLMSSQQRGMSQVMRNINDGTSMLQVADSAMASIGDSLQRLRELAVQSGSGAMSDGDRGALQAEAVQILAQITDVGARTAFNGQTLFSQDAASIGGDARKRNVIDGLKTGWLASAEAMVKKYYGIEGDGAAITVNLGGVDDGPSNVLASVSGTTQANGKVTSLSLNLDMADFGGGATADGGAAFLYNDRVIAHEMVHAIMDRSMNMNSLPDWFKEGTAELIQGSDERLANAIAGAGGSAASIVSGVTSGGFSYEGAYAAARYMHDKLKALGVDGGMKGLMSYLNKNQGANLDTALNAVTGGQIADTNAFLNDFHANGVVFINTKMNLTNADTGAIGGLDADGGPSLDARSVVSDVGATPADQPLLHFKTSFPDIGGNANVNRVQIQVGAGTGKDDLIELSFSAMNAQALGLADLDLKRSAVALLHIDQAIDFVDRQRVVVGAASNRLDMVAANTENASVNLAASQSRIQDVDYASSAARLTRAQILQQAASAMLTQANGQASAVLALLR
jgi:flagellin